MSAYLKITLKKSLSGQSEYQRRVVKGLGLRKLNSFVVKPNRPEIRGMVAKVLHLVYCQEIEAPDAAISGRS